MRIAAMLLGLGMLTACATMQTIREARTDVSKGSARDVEGSCAENYRKAVDVAWRLGWNVETQDAEHREILASAHDGGYGQRIGVWLVDGPRPETCRLRVYSRRVLATDIASKNWEPAFFDAFAGK